MTNCSTDLETEVTPDGQRRCEECGHAPLDRYDEYGHQLEVSVRCTNAAIKEVQ